MKIFTRGIELQEAIKKVAMNIARNLSLLYDDAIEEKIISDYLVYISPHKEYGYSVIIYPSYGKENKDVPKFFYYSLMVFITPEGGYNEDKRWIDSNVITITIHPYGSYTKLVTEVLSKNLEIDLSKFNDAIASLFYRQQENTENPV